LKGQKKNAKVVEIYSKTKIKETINRRIGKKSGKWGDIK
jgi:hypothetical protein